MSIRKNISFIFSAQILNTLIGFVSSIIITRILGAEGRGENAIFTNSTAFAVLFFGFSINSTIPYFINSGKAKAEELLSTIVLFSVGSAVLVFGALSLLENLGKLNWVLSNHIQTLQYKIIFTGIYLCTLLNGILSTYLLTFKKFKQVSIYGVLFQALPLAIYCLLYLDVIPYDHQQPFIPIVNTLAVVAVLSLMAIILIFRQTVPVRPAKKLIPGNMVKQFLFFSSMAYIGNVATFLNYKLDFWVVDEYWGKSQLGIYSLAAQLSQLLWILPSAVSSVLYTYASKCSEAEAVQYTIRLKQIAFYATLVLGVAGLIIAYFFIPVLYGKEFAGAFKLMSVFILGVIPFSIPTVIASLFAARGNFKMSFILSMIIFGVSALMYFTLIPRFGLIGGAIASAIAYILGSILCEVWFCKQFKVSGLNLFMFEPGFLSAKKITSYFKQ